MLRPLSASSRVLLLATLGLLLLGLGSLLWSWYGPDDPRLVHEIPPPPAIDGAFSLVDQQGRRRDDREFRGRYLLVTFGYSRCADACPAALRAMSLAIDALAERDAAAAARVVPIFITVDPAHDSVAVLRDFAAKFHPRLLALTGDRAALAAVAAGYRVLFPRDAPMPTAGDDAAAGAAPDADATAIYLMGPAGGYVTRFPHNIGPAELAAAIAHQMER